jgi:multicomponent Na+:H+ antiporter subunit F
MNPQPWVEAAAAAVLLLLAPVFVRVCRGPALEDRLLGIQALGTSGTALLLLLAQIGATPGLVDAALVMALLSALAMLTLTRMLHLDSRTPS